MPDSELLVAAEKLAGTNKAHYPNESAEYRAARNALLAEEIELRRHIERVARQRRGLPIGGAVAEDYEFISESGQSRLSKLFGDKDTLMVYSMMYGPQRTGPCPVCTSFLSSWNGVAINLRERVGLVVTARSPIERLMSYRQQRGFVNLPFVCDESGRYTRTYVNADDEDVPGFSVFTRQDGVVRHFYSGEMGGGMQDPGQDPRGAPDLDPLWLLLDLTPEGRGTDWYPRLEYGRS
jgi:predicted dithiol-disulfide oxidoreductase (DUF899 family)